jgi:tripartite-type tricarboxylate transporter receptor subunit TctC
VVRNLQYGTLKTRIVRLHQEPSAVTFDRIVRRAGQALVALSVMLAPYAYGDPSYPSKPIKIVVPFVTGGLSDYLGRVVADALKDSLGATVVVENRPGAGGNIGMDAVAKSAPDGYTLGLATVGFASNSVLMATVPFDPIRDFTPVLMVGSIPSVVVVHPSVPVKTMQEFVAYAKSNPDKLSFGSSGPGTGSHLAVELFKSATNTRMTHIPYKGTAQAIPDLLSGRIDFMFDFPTTAVEPVKAGKLNALAVTSMKRVSALPNVPTVAETGVTGFEFGTWAGVLGPAGMSPDVTRKIAAALASALEKPEIRARLVTQNVDITALGPQPFGDFIRADIERWRKLVRDGNVAMLN